MELHNVPFFSRRTKLPSIVPTRINAFKLWQEWTYITCGILTNSVLDPFWNVVCCLSPRTPHGADCCICLVKATRQIPTGFKKSAMFWPWSWPSNLCARGMVYRYTWVGKTRYKHWIQDTGQGWTKGFSCNVTTRTSLKEDVDVCGSVWTSKVERPEIWADCNWVIRFSGPEKGWSAGLHVPTKWCDSVCKNSIWSSVRDTVVNVALSTKHFSVPSPHVCAYVCDDA